MTKTAVPQFFLDSTPEATIVLSMEGDIIQVNTQTEKLFGYRDGELIGQCVDVLVPEGLRGKHERLRLEYQTHPTHSHREAGQKFLGRRKDGKEFYVDISLRYIEGGIDTEPIVISSVRDVTSHVKTQNVLAEKVHQLEALDEIVVAISSTHNLDKLLTLIVEQAVNLVSASSCSVLMPDEATGELVFRASVDDIVGIRVPSGEGIVSRIVNVGKPEIINDVPSDPDYYSFVDETAQIQIKTMIVVPLRANNGIIGALTAVNKIYGKFTQSDCDLLITLANHAAIAIQNARLYEKTQHHAEELESEVTKRTEALRTSQSVLKQRNLELNRLYRAADTLFFTDAPNMENVAGKIVETILSEFGKSNCSLFTINQDLQEVERVAVRGPYSDEVSKGEISLDKPSIVARTVRLAKIINVPDVQNDPDYAPNWKAARSEMAIPLMVGGQVIGVIDVQSTDLNAFGPDDERLMSIFAERAALALENVRLFEAERQRRIEAETLRHASAVVAATLQQDKAIDEILIQLAYVVPYDSASVQLLIDGFLEIVGGRGWQDADMVVGMCFPVPGENPNTDVIRSGKALIIKDTREQYSLSFQDYHKHIRSWMGVPLIVRERVIGMLSVDSTRVNYYTPEHTRLATAFADQVAIAIDNAQLFEKTQSTLAETQMLYRIARSLISSDNLTELLQSLVDNVALHLPAERVSLIILDLISQEITDFIVGGPGKDQIIRVDFEELWAGLTGWVLREIKPALSLKGVFDPRESAEVQKQRINTGCGAIVVVPLFHRDEVIGTMTVINRMDQDDFTQRDVELLETIANQAAIAIQNARLFEEIQWLATMDELTGINNRRHLFQLGRLEIERARRYGYPLSVIMLDIDHFKTINDTYGHGVGDQVLRKLAQGCLQSIREFDILGRYGGEEFAIVLPQTKLSEGEATAERLRVCIQKEPIKTAQGKLPVTISLGVAEMDDEIVDLATLLDRADSALYAAKQAGRNCVQVYE